MSRRRNTQSQSQKSDRVATVNTVARHQTEDSEHTMTRSSNFCGFDDLPLGGEEENVKITVSFDLSNKSYGRGASCMCSITIPVARQDQAIKDAFNLARIVVEAEAQEALKVAEGLVPDES